MFDQPRALLEESRALHSLLAPRSDNELEQPTLFKGWTALRIVRHLHAGNLAADMSFSRPKAFAKLAEEVMPFIYAGDVTSFEARFLDGLDGRPLIDTWITTAENIAERFGAAEPKARVPWFGPDMSVLSSVSARLMETWAHAQAIYDLLCVDRQDQDYIRNIAHLGVNTFGWTFKNRKLSMPEAMPYLRLTAPSGEVWEWGEPCEDERIEGLASQFCQVVAQTRNIADTSLKVTGPIATEWMSKAQCFAGPPETPPAPGQRRKG